MDKEALKSVLPKIDSISNPSRNGMHQRMMTEPVSNT
jgi:hypothetical protein